MPTDPPFLAGLERKPIGADVDTSRFKCNDEIDWYLCEAAADHHEKRITTVTCWLHEGDLVGYIATSMTTVELYSSNQQEQLGLKEVRFRAGATGRWRYFPAFLIGMLGVCERYRRRGLGEHMVKFAIGQARAICANVGCRFVTVDSDPTPEATGLYEKLRFLRVEGQDKKRKTIWMCRDLRQRTPTPDD
jgi:GNAT superfamily N-acetyltransferase